MKLKIWQVDAFASKPLEGNPAAIVPLESTDDGARTILSGPCALYMRAEIYV